MSSDDKKSPSYFTLTDVKVTLRMKCPNCGKWNNVAAQKVMLHLDTDEQKIDVYLPAYLPTKAQACAKCKTAIADPSELIRIKKS